VALPFLARTDPSLSVLSVIPSLSSPAGFAFGIVLTVAGYAGTLWCYAIMGNAWRMGVNRAEKTALVTRGPFQFVRHPIYLFQIVMLAGAALLLPTPVSLAILVIHIVCCLTKAADEEAHLSTVLGEEYRDYLSRTGRFFPKLRPRSR